MSLKSLLYAYILGGLTFIPLVIAAFIWLTIYTSIPVGVPDPQKGTRNQLEDKSHSDTNGNEPEQDEPSPSTGETYDMPKTRKGWLTVRRSYEDQAADGGYVTLVRGFLDSRSKDPKRARPKDMWYVALKGKVLYLYEDEGMKECEAAIELSGYDPVIYPEGLTDAELFAKRNAICLKPKAIPQSTSEVKCDVASDVFKEPESQEPLPSEDDTSVQDKDAPFTPSTSWFIFVRSNVDMEDWYLALIHASDHPPQTPTLLPLLSVFQYQDMAHLVATLDEQPDVIPMRWFNGLVGRVFFSHYRTQALESFIIGRLMKKLAKVKTPSFLKDIAVTEVSVGNRPPMFSKPMLKELTKEGDAAMELHVLYKGEIRITVAATALIQLGTFKSYTVKLVLAVVVRELEGNLLIKVKRPPSNRIWYAFTQTPRMVMSVEPIVSDRQVTLTMILSTLESKLREIIQESIVMPNMDDIAYYDSSPFTHRGGIWSDSGRKVSPTPIPSQMKERSRSNSSSSPGINISPEPSKKPGDAASLSTSETSSISSYTTAAMSTASTPKRRTWFSSSADDNVSSAAIDNVSSSPPGETDTILESMNLGRSKTTNTNRLPHPGVPLEPSSPAVQELVADIPEASHRRSLSSGPILIEESYDSSLGAEMDEDRPNIVGKLSSSPNGFLSTLKARAADKQALHTARDTMKKWGVNWGGLKKDLSDGENSIFERSRRVSTPSMPPTPPPVRMTYADVRAAVAERRERNGGEPSPHLGPETQTPEPRSRTVSQGSMTTTTSNTASPLLTSIFPPSPGPPPSVVLPPVSKPTPSISDEQPSTNPIHVQPQGRSMTIPGIHAKNRGEVMSMGNVAADRSESESPHDGKQKSTPSIQSVYTRLWKSGPTLSDSGTGTSASSSSSPAPTLEEDKDSISSGRSRRDSTTSLKHHSKGRRKSNDAPSYPPRITEQTAATSISRPELQSHRMASEGGERSSTEALRSIVSKDDEKRRGSLELAAGSPGQRSPPTRTRKASALLPGRLMREEDGEMETPSIACPETANIVLESLER